MCRDTYTDEPMEVGAVGMPPLAAEITALWQETATLQMKSSSLVKDGRLPGTTNPGTGGGEVIA